VVKLEQAQSAIKVCAREFGEPCRADRLAGLFEGLEGLLHAVIGASCDAGRRVSGSLPGAKCLVRVRISRLAKRIVPERISWGPAPQAARRRGAPSEAQSRALYPQVPRFPGRSPEAWCRQTDFGRRAYALFVTAANLLQSPLLLVISAAPLLFLAALPDRKGKLLNIAKVIDFFTSLGIPAPTANAYFVSTLECFGGLLPGDQRESRKCIRQEMRRWKLHCRSDNSIEDLARMFNAKIRGWMQYYGRY
jgi:hypothetical protein